MEKKRMYGNYKKLLLCTVMCCLAALMFMVNGMNSKAAASGDWQYEITEGYATVTGYTGSSSDISIPESLGGYKVMAIGNYAFENNSVIQSVTIPKDVVHIGSNAFRNCINLSKMAINAVALSDLNSYYNVFYGAGTNTDGITVIFGEGVTRIPAGLFCTSAAEASHYCRVISVTIPDSVTEIGNTAFYNCRDLKTVAWGQGITSIGDSAFYNCYELQSVTLPKNLISLGYYTFQNCGKLQNVTVNAAALSDRNYENFRGAGINTSGINVTFGEDVVRIPAGLFYVNDESAYCRITSMAISDSVTEIGYNAFRNCRDLKTIKWGQGITSIGDYAFYNVAIESLELPDSVLTVGSYAFNSCNSLKSLTLSKKLTAIRDRAFGDCGNLQNITINTETKGDIAQNEVFYGLGTKTDGVKVAFGENVTYISSNLFSVSDSTAAYSYYCRITSVSIPDSVTEIGSSAFRNCRDLKTVEWGQGLINIGNNAFYNCYQLQSVTLPKKMLTLGYGAFWGCGSIQSITLDAAKMGDVNDSVFYGAGTNTEGIIVTFGEEVERIPANLFFANDTAAYCRIISVSMPDSVTEIGNNAFRNCRDLQTVSWGQGLTGIGDGAFCDCHQLQSVTIPEKVIKIGAYAFQECKNLKSIVIEAAVLGDVSTNTFYNAGVNTEGISVTFGEGVTRIPARMFYVYSNTKYCRITSVTIPKSVREVGVYAFETSYDLSSVTYKGTEADWGKISIQNYNTYLKNVVFEAPEEPFFGWREENGLSFWYENGVKQGLEGRGKEIYDPGSDAWYWLDSIQGGAKAVSKDVYQESYSAYPDREDGTGKWVRYDADGHMVKGWQDTEAGTYYFELITGAMAKGVVEIDGNTYVFDWTTGILLQ